MLADTSGKDEGKKMLKVIKGQERAQLKKRLLQRANGDFEHEGQIVKQIVADVAARGDAALFEYSKKLDGFSAHENNIVVTQQEIAQAYEEVDGKILEVVKHAAENIKAFHQRQKRQSFTYEEDGKLLGQLIRPLDKAGVYVPGGKAVYPSSVLMNIIPAKVAGVKEIFVATPPDKQGKINPLTLCAADIAGATGIYKMGGAQAVAAFAYGTDTIPRVDKITGPGNIFVALAKKEVYGQVGIDMIAGPSEILILADESATPKLIAADFLSQAEHDELAACVLVTHSQALAQAVQQEIGIQVEKLPKKEIVCKSLENYGTIIITENVQESVAIANEIAPEHLEICLKNPRDYLMEIKNAGSIFVGEYSPEPLGDYFAGPNHILPTNGSARFSSPLSVDDFIKKSSVICYSKEALEEVYQEIFSFAEMEDLMAHARAVKIRFEDI